MNGFLSRLIVDTSVASKLVKLIAREILMNEIEIYCAAKHLSIQSLG